MATTKHNKGASLLFYVLFAYLINCTTAGQNLLASLYKKASEKNSPVVLVLNSAGQLKDKLDDKPVEVKGHNHNSLAYAYLQRLLDQNSHNHYHSVKSKNPRLSDQLDNKYRYRYNNDRNRDRRERKYRYDRYDRDRSVEYSNKHRHSDNYRKDRHTYIKERLFNHYDKTRLRSDQLQDRLLENQDTVNQNKREKYERKDREKRDREERDRRDREDRERRVREERDRRDREEREKRDRDDQDKRDRVGDNKDKGKDMKLNENDSARVQVPVVKRLLRSLNCQAREECEDSCYGKKKNECEDECEEKYECDDDEYEYPCAESNHCDNTGSTRGVTLETEQPGWKKMLNKYI